jgi:radical SAM protein with 4Fe4S-binding SPASM domain
MRGICGPDVSVSDFVRIADILSHAGIRDLDILGGEPVLHPALMTLVDIACSKKFRVSLSSNASDLDLLQTMSSRFDRSSLQIGISLNGPRIDGRLLSFIRDTRPMLKSVCTAKSFLPAYAPELLALPDVRYYAIFMDTMSEADLDYSLSFPEFHEKLGRLRASYANLEGVHCSGFIPYDSHQPELAKARCPAGTMKLSIMPDGSVYPCYLLFSRPEYKLGNILTAGFQDLIHSPILEWFRTFRGNECPSLNCKLHSICNGGCPAISLLISGDIKAPDPRCEFMP